MNRNEYTTAYLTAQHLTDLARAVQRGQADAQEAAAVWTRLPALQRQSPAGQLLMHVCHQYLTPPCAQCGRAPSVVFCNAVPVCAACYMERPHANDQR